MDLDNAALPRDPSWQLISKNWDQIITHSAPLKFALPADIPAPIRHCLNIAHAAGKSSVGNNPIDYQGIYPVSATTIQSEVIDNAICLGQGLALMASKPSTPPPSQIISQPSPPTQIVHTPSPPNPSAPEKFDGTRSQFGSFVTKLQLQFRANSNAFSSEESKILYAGSYLTGNAYVWFEPHVDQTTGNVSFTTFAEFLQSLRAAFDDPDAYATSERQLEALRQEASCAAYYAKIVSLFSLLGWAEPKVQIHHFRKGLKEVLKDALVGKKMPVTFPEFAAECITLDNEIFARIREKKSSNSPESNQTFNPLPKFKPTLTVQQPFSENSGGDPMELDNSEAGKAARKAYRRANNLCGYCG